MLKGSTMDDSAYAFVPIVKTISILYFICYSTFTTKLTHVRNVQFIFISKPSKELLMRPSPEFIMLHICMQFAPFQSR